MLKRLFTICLLANCHLLMAQTRAVPVEESDPALQVNAERDRYAFADNYYKRGEQSTDQGMRSFWFEKSARQFESFLEAFPRSVKEAEARYRLGTSYLYTGQPREAENQFRLVINRYPEGHMTSLSAYRLASLRYQSKDYEGAAPYFSRSAEASDLYQMRQRARYFEANCYLIQKRKRAARKALSKLLKDDEKGKTSHYHKGVLQLGLIYQEEDNWPKALSTFEKLFLKNVPADIRGQALVGAGHCAAQLGQTKQADIYLEAVLESKDYAEQHEKAQMTLMFSAEKAEDTARVLKIYKRRPIRSRGEVPARLHALAGKAAAKLEKYKDAITIFMRAERAFPRSELAFDVAYRRLLCFYNIKGSNVPAQVDSFVELYRHAHPASPRIQTARLMKGETLFNKKRYVRAAKVYNQINSRLIDEKNRAGMLHHKGWCLAESGDPNGAIQSFSEFISSYPQDPRLLPIIVRRGQAYHEAGNYKQALKDFDRVISQAPKTGLAAMSLQQSAEVQRKQGNYRNMIIRYSQLLQDHPNLQPNTLANANYHIGDALFKESKFPEAAQKFQKARELDPENMKKLCGSRIALCAYMHKDVEALLTAVKRIQTDVPDITLPDRLITWLGIKSFERRDFSNAVYYLASITNNRAPDETTPYIWKHLAKAAIQTGAYEMALNSIEHVLEKETNAISKADALLDKGTALLGLKRQAEAIETAEAGLELQRQGKLNAELQLLLGDISFSNANYKEAAKKYVVTAELVVDNQLTPQAVYKAGVALQRDGDLETAKTYKKRLATEFPNFKLRSKWVGGPTAQ